MVVIIDRINTSEAIQSKRFDSVILVNLNSDMASVVDQVRQSLVQIRIGPEALARRDAACGSMTLPLSLKNDYVILMRPYGLIGNECSAANMLQIYAIIQ